MADEGSPSCLGASVNSIKNINVQPEDLTKPGSVCLNLSPHMSFPSLSTHPVIPLKPLCPQSSTIFSGNLIGDLPQGDGLLLIPLQKPSTFQNGVKEDKDNLLPLEPQQKVNQFRNRIVFGLSIGITVGGVVLAGGSVFTAALATAVFAGARVL